MAPESSDGKWTLSHPLMGFSNFQVWDSNCLWPWLSSKPCRPLVCARRSLRWAQLGPLCDCRGLRGPGVLQVFYLCVTSQKMTCHRSVKSKDQIYLIQHPSGSLQLCHWGKRGRPSWLGVRTPQCQWPQPCFHALKTPSEPSWDLRRPFFFKARNK